MSSRPRILVRRPPWLCLVPLVGTALFVAASSSALSKAPPRSAASVFWSGRSGGYAWRFSQRDLDAYRPGRPSSPVLSARRSILQEIRSEAARFPDDPMDCDFDAQLTPLSLVGSVFSYERTDYTYCKGTAHPSLVTSYVAVDAARPGRRASLTDHFPDKDVLKALLADPLIRQAMKAGGVKSARTATELVERLSETAFAGSDGEYSIQADMLTRFAFHHLEGSRVAVRIGLSHGAEVFRGRLTQIGILLPAPKSLLPSLRQASSRKRGFLMKDAKALVKGQSASLEMKFKG